MRSDPTPGTSPAPPAWESLLGLVSVALLLVLRVLCLAGPIDDPHSWRQCDTAYYSLHMARHGIDLLRPQVCWLGGYGTLALEFPLPEALSALFQRAFRIGVMWDRVVSLGFFAIATVYFHALARRVLQPRPAALATLAYLAMPLGIFFSRAAIVDFVAVAFAHAFLHHGLTALERGRARDLALATGAGALAALIKAPVLFPIALALAWVALRSNRSTWWRAAVPLAVTALVFAMWRAHVEALNSAAPDWSFIPGYHKIAGRWSWYFGGVASRLDARAWLQLFRRIVDEETTRPGALLAIVGVWGWRKAAATSAGETHGLAAAWAVSALVYVLVFWPLNLLHDYYQIPLLAPAALAIGAGGGRLFPAAGRWWSPRGLAARAAFTLFVAFAVVATFAIGYFQVDQRLVDAGNAIDRLVPKDDLVIAAFPGSRYADPRLLFRADRRGWSLDVSEVTPEVVRGLESAGAKWVAVLTTPGRTQPPAFLDSLHVARLEIGAGQGSAGGSTDVLDVFSLARRR